jgi:hypothetical protein
MTGQPSHAMVTLMLCALLPPTKSSTERWAKLRSTSTPLPSATPKSSTAPPRRSAKSCSPAACLKSCSTTHLQRQSPAPTATCKTRKLVDIPLCDEDGTVLWPELVARLDAAPRDIKAACDKSGRTSLRAAVGGSWAGHRRDTGRPQKTKPLKFLALPRGLEPLFSP